MSSRITRTFDFLHHVLDYLEALTTWLVNDRRFAKPSVVESRASMCGSCPLNNFNVCGSCGCNIGKRPWWAKFTSKIYYPSEQCPEGLW